MNFSVKAESLLEFRYLSISLINFHQKNIAKPSIKKCDSISKVQYYRCILRSWGAPKG